MFERNKPANPAVTSTPTLAPAEALDEAATPPPAASPGRSAHPIKPRFWRGQIASEAQAKLIIRWASWSTILLAFFPARESISAFLRGGTANGIGAFIIFMILFGPAILLLNRKTIEASVALLVVTALPTIMAFAEFVQMSVSRRGAGNFLFIVLIFLALTMQASRAFQAVKALPQLRAGEAFS